MFDLFDFENTTPSRNFGSNARGGVLEYVDHCFGTLRVPYLSLIFLLRYIVSSPLFLVIYGSELKVITTITKRQAMKVISTTLATGTVRIVLDFANNGACYKFHLKNPRAGQYRHQQDHGQI